MKKTKTFAKTYDISKNLYYDHSLYEHDHKDTHTKDLITSKDVSFRERNNMVAHKITENGILYN